MIFESDPYRIFPFENVFDKLFVPRQSEYQFNVSRGSEYIYE